MYFIHKIDSNEQLDEDLQLFLEEKEDKNG
jgi:hypothetical protein